MKELKAYYKACEGIRKKIAEKFLEYDDSHWIGDEIGGTLYFNDCYLDMEYLVKVLELDLAHNEFLEWYWWQLDWYTEHDESPPLNMKHFIKLHREGGMEAIETFLKDKSV